MRTTVIATTAFAAAAAAGLISAPAHAGVPDPDPQGRVIARNGLAARALPSAHSQRYGTFPRGKVLTINCKVPGTNVRGNRWWYQVLGEGPIWVSARYVRNLGPAPDHCDPNDGTFPASATTGLNQRQGPHVRDVRLGRFASGAIFQVQCFTGDGSNKWLLTGAGRWVKASYVNYPAEVNYCFNG